MHRGSLSLFLRIYFVVEVEMSLLFIVGLWVCLKLKWVCCSLWVSGVISLFLSDSVSVGMSLGLLKDKL